MNINRKTWLMLILVVVAGYGFIEIVLNVSPLRFLATIGAWILLGLLYYDYHCTQKEWERKHTQR